MGGVAAAIAAADAGVRVFLTEATDWLGGQMTSQGVSALDEHEHIETFGGTRLYNELRARIRDHYVRRGGAPTRMPDGAPLNPGNGWVSRLCFEPRVGLSILEGLLAPYVESGHLTVLLRHRPVAQEDEGQVLEVRLASVAGERVRVRAAYFLDATDTGELLPLTGTAYVTGAESRDDTGEPHAKDGPACPDEVQGFTYPFAVDYRPGEDHTIAKPPGYERFRDSQPYTLQPGGDGRLRFRVFERGPSGELPFWTYRRIRDGRLLGGGRDPELSLPARGDIAMINWAGNDYYAKNLL